MAAKLTSQEQYQERMFDEKAGKTKFYTVGGRANRNHQIKFNRLFEFLRLKPGDRVLEVGCGEGEHAAWFLEREALSFTGIDISQGSLDVAEERLAGYRDRSDILLKKDNANALSFEDGSFDAVFCAATLHHMEKPERMVREMVRVARRGGRIAMMEPNWIYPTNIGFMIMLKEDRHMWLMRRNNFRKWLVASGAAEVGVEHLLYTPPVPKSLLPLYDRIDRICGAVPGLRRCSLMLFGHGVKR